MESNTIPAPQPNFLTRLILLGHIPGLVWLKRIVWWAALIVPFVVIVEPMLFKPLGALGWQLLMLILLVRPLADIFPEFGILRTGVTCRKEGGLLAGTLILGHAVGFFLTKQLPLTAVVTADFWVMENALAWGFAGLLAAIPLIATTNVWSMRLLGRWWKRVQQLAYVFFFLGNAHLFFLGKVDDAIVASVLVAGLWLLARVDVKLRPLAWVGIAKS